LRKCFIAEFDGVCSSDIYPLVVNEDKVIPEYLFAILSSHYFSKLACTFEQRAGIPKINRKELYSIDVPIPEKFVQKKYVAKLMRDLTTLKGLINLVNQAQKVLTRMSDSIWK
jgi:restriction endonuclease S subunit